MAQFMELGEAIDAFVSDGCSLAMEGFTHLIPQAAGHEIIRRGKRDLTLIRMTPDMIYDQLIGMGCARKLVFSWGGNPGVGSLHRFRDAIENGWPQPLEIEEHSHAGIANAYQAGASGLPFAVLRGYLGTGLPTVNSTIRRITCPYTGEQLATVPAIRPDVGIVHAQKADRLGNVLITGLHGVQKEVVLASGHAIVTVEEVVDSLDAELNSVVIPHWVISAICEVPYGAHPSYAQGYYGRDNAFYSAWDEIARDRDSFRAWMEEYIVGTADHAAFLAAFEQRYSTNWRAS